MNRPSRGAVDLTEGPVLRRMLQYFFPVFLGMLFQQLYNTVDSVVVGRFVGTEALASVGGNTRVIINLVIGIFTGLASGATVIISQQFGAKDNDRLKRTVHTILLFCVFIGLFITVGGYFFVPVVLRWLDVPEDIFDRSTEYLRIYFAGGVPLLLYNVGAGILRAVGDSRRPLYILMACCCTNIVLDVLFVAVFSWESAGAAAATVLAQLVSALLVLTLLARSEEAYRFIPKELRIDPPLLRHAMMIGIPSALQNSMYSVSNMIIMSAVNRYKTVAIAAWAASSALDGMFWLTATALGVAVCSFAGQCFGAGNTERLREGVRKWMLFSIIVTAALSAVLLGFGRPFLRLVSDDPDVIDMALVVMWHMVPFYVIWIIVEITTGTLRGVGDVFRPTIIVMLGVCVFRILWISFVLPHFPGIETICDVYPVTWGVTSTAILIYFFRSDWLGRSRRNEEKEAERSRRA